MKCVGGLKLGTWVSCRMRFELEMISEVMISTDLHNCSTGSNVYSRVNCVMRSVALKPRTSFFCARSVPRTSFFSESVRSVSDVKFCNLFVYTLLA